MIYIIRHQIGYRDNNCLNELGIHNSKKIATFFKKKKIDTIITKLTNIHKHKTTSHIRPIETASIISGILNINLTVVENYTDILHYITNNDLDIVDSKTNNVLIVWHHRQIPNILNSITKKNNHFIWANSNFAGCIIVDSIKWYYVDLYK